MSTWWPRTDGGRPCTTAARIYAAKGRPSFNPLIVHLPDRAAAERIALFDDAAALGLPVSTDLHDWDGSTPYYLPFAWRADLVFLSAAVLGQGVFEVMRAILRNGRARVVVATDGAKGSYSLARGEDIIRHTACAMLEGAVVDSNGAGDAFSSAFLHAWFEAAPLDACMRTGAIGGAYACRFHGTAERSLGLDDLARYRAAA